MIDAACTSAELITIESGLSADHYGWDVEDQFTQDGGWLEDVDAFTYSNHGVHIIGNLGEHSAGHGADVTFDTIEVLGADQCSTGTFNIARSE